MASYEKGRPAGGDPIPEIVLADKSEFKPTAIDLQVRRLTRRCRVGVDMAKTLAPLAFGVAS
jgi:hypothetical protein